MSQEKVFQTEDDVVDAFTEVMGNETQTKFQEGQVIRIAVEEGFSEKRLKQKIANRTGKSKKTIERRFNVANTFQEYDPSKDWYLYYIASTYVDYSPKADKETQERQKIKARDYIETALSQNLLPPQLNKLVKADKIAEGRLKAPPKKIAEQTIADSPALVVGKRTEDGRTYVMLDMPAEAAAGVEEDMEVRVILRRKRENDEPTE